MKNSLNDNNLNDNKKFDFSKINIDTIVTFCRNNTRYVSAGVLTVILIVVLAVTAANNGKSEGKEEVKQEQVADAQDAYEVNENKELNSLISKYYELYAAGNVDELAKVATPFSDMEKSYVQMMSGYVEGYNNIDCYTKKGLEENSYMVSATYEMKLSGAEGTVPGMEFFYVRTKEDGSLYIDNVYGTFNSEMKELETDPEVMALIEKFNDASDVKELVADFQSRYTKAIEQDENLRNMVNTVTAGIVSWKDSYLAQQQAAEQAAAEQAAAEQAAAEQAAAEQAAAEQAAAEQAAAEQAAAEQAAAEQAAAEQAAQQQQQETNNGLNYLPEGTTLTATDAYNIRVSMSETSDKVGTTAIGDTIKVVLSYEEGWTKVEWNGKTGYIKTELLLNN